MFYTNVNDRGRMVLRRIVNPCFGIVGSIPTDPKKGVA